MSLAARVSYEACWGASRWSALRHIGIVDGLEHIPESGPFILVGNHTSFYDHVLVELGHYAVRGRPLYFVTKRESFDRRFLAWWQRAQCSLPMDRDRPDATHVKALDDVLAQGSALCIYPEGTRNPDDTLMPFKAGALWLAMRKGVPIVPFAIAGSRAILPTGAWLPRSGKANLVFGPPLALSYPAGRRRERLDLAVAEAETAVSGLVERARSARLGREPSAAASLTAVAAWLMHEGLGDTKQPRLRYSVRARIKALLRLARQADPDYPGIRVQELRLLGLRAIGSRGPMRMWRGISVLSMAEDVVKEQPSDPMGRYVLGRALLTAPTFGGGDRERGLQQLGEAVRLGPNDARFRMALAEACAAAGQHDRAHALASEVLEIEQRDARAELRTHRARTLLDVPPGG